MQEHPAKHRRSLFGVSSSEKLKAEYQIKKSRTSSACKLRTASARLEAFQSWARSNCIAAGTIDRSRSSLYKVWRKISKAFYLKWRNNPREPKSLRYGSCTCRSNSSELDPSQLLSGRHRCERQTLHLIASCIAPMHLSVQAVRTQQLRKVAHSQLPLE